MDCSRERDDSQRANDVLTTVHKKHSVVRGRFPLLSSEIRVVDLPDLTISELKSGRSRIRIRIWGELVSCYRRQYSSVLLLLRHCLPAFDEICGMATNILYRFLRVSWV